MFSTAALATVLVTAAPLPQTDDPSDPLLTRAERSEFGATSSSEDVVRFLDELQRRGAPLRVDWIGHSTKGQPIPLAIASRPAFATPGAALRSGRPIVFLQANIHGAEVEGKEAVLALLRDLGLEKERNLLDELILLVLPIYNIDGNDAWGDVADHRPSQNGPDRVGLRPNGQGYDLNRDCMKADSPEMRAVLDHIWNRWNPDVLMDLHTTDGTRHGYALTYAPSLAPDTEAGVLAFTRDRLLPTVRQRMRERHGLETQDYGNTSRRAEDPSWYTFGCEPRYVTNYGGLRHRISILSEATSYSSFEDRIVATRRFVDEVLAYVVEHAEEVVRLTRDADARVTAWGEDPSTAPPMGLRFQMASRGVEDVLIEKRESRPRGPLPVVDIEAVPMEVHDRFEPSETSTLPYGYLLPPDLPAIADLLQRHGIVVEILDQGWQGKVETFTITRRQQRNRPFQGHRMNDLEGEWTPSERNVAPGTLLVRSAQPLGILAFHLLEPRSLDGVAGWGLLDSTLHEGGDFVIRRALSPLDAPRRRR